VLDDVEVTPVTIDGSPGDAWVSQQWTDTPPYRMTNTLNYGRQSHAMVRSGNHVYVLGGVLVDDMYSQPPPDIAATATTERARILGLETQPDNAAAAVIGAGGISGGVWYYAVSAVDADGEESLASREVMVYATAASEVEITWDPVPGADLYVVYRTRAADTYGPGPEFLATVDPLVSGEVYDDTAAAPPTLSQTVTPLPPGSLGLWWEDESMNLPRGGMEAIAISISGGTKSRKFVYAAGGRTNNAESGSNFLSSLESAEVFPDGSLSPFLVEPEEMTSARVYFGFVSNLAEETFIGPPSDPGEGPVDTGLAAGAIILVAGEGDTSWNNQTGTVETCRVVKENGTLSEWTEQGTWSQISEYGHDIDLFFNHVFVLPGAKSSTDGYNAAPEGVTSSPKRIPFNEPPAGPGDLGLVAGTTTSSSGGFPEAKSRAYYSAVRMNGYVFVTGGNSGAAGPVANIARFPQ
jgi:hypothetical protein